MGMCWNSAAADAEAHRTGREEAEEAALEVRKAEAGAATALRLTEALAGQPGGDLPALVAAIDEHASHDGGPCPLAIADAAMGRPGALIAWVREAIARAAGDAADAVTPAAMAADEREEHDYHAAELHGFAAQSARWGMAA